MHNFNYMRHAGNIFLVALAVLMVACSSRELNTKTSNTTGWNYFDEKTTNFEAIEGVATLEKNNFRPPCALISLIFSSLDPETNCLFYLRIW